MKIGIKMKKIVMLISLVIFGLVFNGCAAKDARAAKMNEIITPPINRVNFIN
jgi:PBP1b-binding outer membrane lipoprotein LpoB